MFKNRTIIAVVGILATSVALTACSMSGMNMGGDSSSSSAADERVNDQDVSFAQSMVLHHTQAVEMADVILAKDGVDTRITELAQTIKDAQAPEIDLMDGWLEEWGASDDMSGMDHGTDGKSSDGTVSDGTSSDGMMSDDDMAALESATGIDASRLFLEQMTEHHNGAIAMSQTEVDSGESPDAITLAQK